MGNGTHPDETPAELVLTRTTPVDDQPAGAEPISGPTTATAEPAAAPAPAPTPDDGFDVFLSHHSADKDHITYVAQKLREEGITGFLDKWHLDPGVPWQRELEGALLASRSFVLFIGGNGVGRWAEEELRVAIDRQTTDRRFRVIPVILPSIGDTPPEQVVPLFLRGRTWIRFATIDDHEALRRLIGAIRGDDGDDVLPDDLGICPYRGLEPFETEHAPFFFGRDRLVDDLVDAVAAFPFLAVLGPSGSGKSSVVKAGLIPRLRAGALPGSETWPVLVLRPGAAPLDALAAQLNQALPVPDFSLVPRFRTDPALLRTVVRSLPAIAERDDRRLLLVVDQFEELYTVCRDRADADAFVAQLVDAATAPGSRTVVVLTMRVDFYRRLYDHPALIELVAAHQVPVSEVNEEETRAIILEPAVRAGLLFDDGLVDTIVDDLAGEHDALPLLEHTLLRLWERREGRCLTLAAYQEIGGLKGSIAQRADEVLGSMSPGEQEIARRILLRMVRPGEGTEDTRQSVRVTDLPGADAAVLDRLVEARLVSSDEDPGEGRTVDVAHEALIRGWPRLRQWIDASRDALRHHAQLTERTQEWHEVRDNGLLLRGSRLRDAVALRDDPAIELSPLELAFIARSLRARRTSRGLQIAGVALLAVLTVVASAGLVVARRAEDRARDGERNARAGDIAATALRDGGDRDRSLLLALAALDLAARPEAAELLGEALAQVNRPVQTTFRSPTPLYTVLALAELDAIAVGGEDGSLRLIDQTTRQERWQVQAHGDWVHRLALSPDGTAIASTPFHFPPEAVADFRLRLWDVRDGSELASGESRDANGKGLDVRDVDFLPDGTPMTIHADGGIRTWRRDGNRLVPEERYRLGTTRLDAFALARDGRTFVVTGSADTGRFSADGSPVLESSIHLWRVGEPAPYASLGGLEVFMHDTEIDPDGRIAVVASQDGRIRMFELASGRYVGDLVGHTSMVVSLAFNPSGTLLASAGIDLTVSIWDMQTPRPNDGVLGNHERVLTGNSNWIWELAFTDDRTLFSASTDRTVRRWDLDAANDSGELGRLAGPATGPRFGADGSVIVTASLRSRQLVARDPSSGSERWSVSAKTVTDAEWATRVAALTEWDGQPAVSRDGTTIAWADDTGRVRRYDARTGAAIGGPLGSTSGVVTRLAFDPGGTVLAIAATEGPVQLVDVERGTVAARLQLPAGERATALAFSPDGVNLVVATSTGLVRRFDVAEHRELLNWPASPSPLLDIAYTPDGSFIVTANDSGIVGFWGDDGLAEGSPIELASGQLVDFDISPDGKLLAVASTDGTTKLFGVAGGRYLGLVGAREMGAANKLVFSTGVAFSPDGGRIARTDSDGSVRIVRLGGRVVADACRTAGRNLTLAEWGQYVDDADDYRRLCPDLPVEADLRDSDMSDVDDLATRVDDALAAA